MRPLPLTRAAPNAPPDAAQARPFAVPSKAQRALIARELGVRAGKARSTDEILASIQAAPTLLNLRLGGDRAERTSARSHIVIIPWAGTQAKVDREGMRHLQQHLQWWDDESRARFVNLKAFARSMQRVGSYPASPPPPPHPAPLHSTPHTLTATSPLSPHPSPTLSAYTP